MPAPMPLGQATVQITLLPGEWANRAWAGHLCGTKLPPGLLREQLLLLWLKSLTIVVKLIQKTLPKR